MTIKKKMVFSNVFFLLHGKLYQEFMIVPFMARYQIKPSYSNMLPSNLFIFLTGL